MKTKWFAGLICIAMLLGTLSLGAAAEDATPVEGFASGSGTKNDPYLISTADQLIWFASSVNGGEDYARKYIQLTDDVALNDTADFETWETTPPANEWIPIGDNINPFAGTFNGNGKTVSGIYISRTMGEGAKSYTGLFGYVKGGRVENTVVDQCYISVTGGEGTSDLFSGGIAGYVIEGTVFNCSATAVQVASHTTPNTAVGGIVGRLEDFSTLTNAESAGSISVMDAGTNAFIGGIAGAHSGGSMINRAISRTNITAKGEVGGIAGIAGGNSMYAHIRNSYNLGNLSGSQFVGGLVGRSGQVINCEVENCFSVGTVSAMPDSTAMVGLLFGAIRYVTKATNCYYIEIPGVSVYNLHGNSTEEVVVFENVTAKEPADFQGLDALTNLGFPEEIWQAVEDGYPVLKLEEQKNPDGGEEDTTAPTTTEPTPTTTEPTPGGDSDGEPTQPADSEDAGTSTPADDEKGCKSSLPAAMVCLLLVGFGTAALCLHKRGNKAH